MRRAACSSVAPALTASVPSFAVVRDPIARFLSAYAYARAGGSAHARVSEPFGSLYAELAGVDALLDHLEAADWPSGVDHIFRPQSWYLTDRRGHLAVDHLIPLRSLPQAVSWLAPWAGALPRVNLSSVENPELTDRQAWRVRYLYAADLELVGASQASYEALRRRWPIDIKSGD